VKDKQPLRLSGKMISIPIGGVVLPIDEEVTITLRRSELRDLIVTITAMYDQSAMSFEEMQHRFPIFANGYDRLCHQAKLAGVPTNSDESID